jgi:cytochrome oxidase assembly protein ShyY1
VKASWWDFFAQDLLGYARHSRTSATATHPVGGANFDHVFPSIAVVRRHVFVRFAGYKRAGPSGGQQAVCCPHAITLSRMRTRQSAVNMVLWTVVVLLLVVVFIMLGRWQWHRTYRPVDGYSAEPAAVSLETLVPSGTAIPPAAVARQVTVTGNYVTTGQEVVQGHSLSGQAVSWVVTPLVMADKTEVLVVRGWIGAGETVLATPPTSSVSVTGRVELGDVLHSGTNTVAQSALPAGYLIRIAQSPPDPLSLQPVPAVPPDDHAPKDFHLQNAIYVVQWYLLAIIALVTWWRFLRASRRPHPADDQQPLVPAV